MLSMRRSFHGSMPALRRALHCRRLHTRYVGEQEQESTHALQNMLSTPLHQRRVHHMQDMPRSTVQGATKLRSRSPSFESAVSASEGRRAGDVVMREVQTHILQQVAAVHQEENVKDAIYHRPVHLWRLQKVREPTGALISQRGHHFSLIIGSARQQRHVVCRFACFVTRPF